MRVILILLLLPSLVFAQTIDVTTFNAYPNDQIDDTNQIQQAINTANTNDVIYIPQGTYLISNSLEIPSTLRLQGSSQQESRLVAQGTFDSFITISSANSIIIAHLTFDGLNKQVNNAITAQNSNNLFLHNLTIKNIPNTGGYGPHAIIFSNNVDDSIVADTVIETIGIGAEFGGGIRLAHGSDRNEIYRNTIRNTGRGGIFCNDNSYDNFIHHNFVRGSNGEGLGIEVWGGCDRSVIEDNDIDHWLSVDESPYTAVRRNKLHDPSDTPAFLGIEFAGGDHLIVTHNDVGQGHGIGLSISNRQPKNYAFWAHNDVHHSTTWAVQIQGESDGASYHYWLNNTFRDVYINHPAREYADSGHGLRFNGDAHFMKFENNTIKQNGGHGIQVLDQNDHLSFVNNKIVNNQLDAIQDYQSITQLSWQSNIVSNNGNNDAPTHTLAPKGPSVSMQAPIEAKVGEQVQFVANANNIAHYMWDFGAGPPKSGSQPTYIYQQPGIYVVTLLAWDTTGNVGTTTKKIVVSSSTPSDPNEPTPVPSNPQSSNNCDPSFSDSLDGTFNGSINQASWSQGMFGQALLLQKSTSATFNSTLASTNATLSFWIKTNNSLGPRWSNMLFVQETYNKSGFRIAIEDGDLVVWTTESGGTIQVRTPLPKNIFTHIGITFNNNQLALYLDGTLVASQTGSYKVSPSTLDIGNVAGSIASFNGLLDEITLYDCIINQTMISQLAFRGDINGDGAANILDLMLLIQQKNIDINANGQIGIDDYIYFIKKFLL